MRPELKDVLDELDAYLYETMDVRDGSDGKQLPNRAMTLLEQLRHARRLPPEAEAIETLRFVREVIRHSPIEHQVVDLDTMTGLGAWLDARLPSPERTK